MQTKTNGFLDSRAPVSTSELHAPPASGVNLKAGASATWPTGMSTDRQALIGALTFMEITESCRPTVAEIIAWVDDCLVQPGYMKRPMRIHEHGSGIVFLDGNLSRPAQDMVLRQIIRNAKKEIYAMLEGLSTSIQDDRFIGYFVATGRVLMKTRNGQGLWTPQPRFNDGLSDIVLALFVADILQNRQSYEERLTVCAECNRISFRPTSHDKQPCNRHGLGAFAALMRTG